MKKIKRKCPYHTIHPPQQENPLNTKSMLSSTSTFLAEAAETQDSLPNVTCPYRRTYRPSSYPRTVTKMRRQRV